MICFCGSEREVKFVDNVAIKQCKSCGRGEFVMDYKREDAYKVKGD